MTLSPKRGMATTHQPPLNGSVSRRAHEPLEKREIHVMGRTAIHPLLLAVILAGALPAVTANAASWKVQCGSGELQTLSTNVYRCLVTTAMRNEFRRGTCPPSDRNGSWRLEQGSYGGANYRCERVFRGRTTYEKPSCPRGWSLNTSAGNASQTCMRRGVASQEYRSPELQQIQ
jgi:hypothetical protein